MRFVGSLCVVLFFAACGGRALTVNPPSGAAVDARADVLMSVGGSAGGQSDAEAGSVDTYVTPPPREAGSAVAQPDLKVTGQACVTGSECLAGFCADGVCCRTACAGPCSTCAATGTVGACTPLAAGTVCGAAACSADVVVTASTCDGGGTCLPGQTQSCTPYMCDPASGSCRSACASVADCVDARCLGGACVRSFLSSCSSAAECASGFCVDGVCCTTACQGACMSCALPGSTGTCAALPTGLLDRRGICRDQGAASCGQNGGCDGQGGCQRYALGTICATTTCVGDMLTNAATCDGRGACFLPSATSCAPLTCRDDVPRCHAGCPSGDSICAAGSYCANDEQCLPKKGLGASCAGSHECISGWCYPSPGGGASTCMTLIPL